MKRLRAIIIFAAVFAAGCMLFFPWTSLQSYAVTEIFRIAANNGVYVSAQNCPSEGFFDKKFICGRVIADVPFMQIKMDSVAVNPSVLNTLSGNPSAMVELGKGSVTLATKQQLNWSEGSFSVDISKDTISVHDIDIKGAFSVQGYFDISRGNGTLVSAQLALTVPQDVEDALELMSRGMIRGLEKTAPGKWRLKL